MTLDEIIIDIPVQPTNPQNLNQDQENIIKTLKINTLNQNVTTVQYTDSQLKKYTGLTDDEIDKI